jgi:hypothetical protein
LRYGSNEHEGNNEICILLLYGYNSKLKSIFLLLAERAMISTEYNVITFMIMVIIIIQNCNFLKKNSLQIGIIMTVNEKEYKLMYVSFWVIARRLNFVCRRFGTLCLFHLQRQVGMKNNNSV